MPALQNRRYELVPTFARGMMFLIDILQPIQGQVGVDLGRRNICVAENRLHGAQVSAVFHHVRGAAVAKHVRAGIATGYPQMRREPSARPAGESVSSRLVREIRSGEVLPLARAGRKRLM